MFRVDPKNLEGRCLERTIIAGAEHRPSRLQETPCERLAVMPTGQLLELIETTAFDVINPHLEQGYRTVGAGIDIRHFAATPESWQVTAVVTLKSINCRKCVFDIAVRDQLEPICTGSYVSYIVDTNRFRSDVEAKRHRLLSPVT